MTNRTRGLPNDKALTGRFEIGSIPMREALQRLAREGLVVHVPDRGAQPRRGGIGPIGVQERSGPPCRLI